MPSLDGATEWLNSEPLGPAQLKDRVVLVNFWTLTCINWLRTEPWVRAWWRAYHDDGLVVVGVHAPEFSFEHETNNVQRAIAERGIDYPVALDNEFRIWRAFDNHYWPAMYFVDSSGEIRDEYFGENRYEESEAILQRLLGIDREPVTVEATGVEAPADWDQLASPETYLGLDRRDQFSEFEAIEDGVTQRRQAPEGLSLNEWALSGDWTSGPENVELRDGVGTLAMRFHARDVHLVLSTKASEPIPFRVALDGEPPGTSKGVDVDKEGNGQLEHGRMYQLLRQQGAIRDRTVTVTFEEPDPEAYVFTFG